MIRRLRRHNIYLEFRDRNRQSVSHRHREQELGYTGTDPTWPLTDIRETLRVHH
jgi:hypothetical protein